MSKDKDSLSAVVQFYESKSIFITGATGFMGKVIVEKLLHTCPGLEKIYLLIRLKNGEDKDQRLTKIKNGPVFQELRTLYPERLKKLVAIEGDTEYPGLGISEADKKLLKQVNVVFNIAATLNFVEDIRKSVVINILATKTLLDMCLEMTNLKSFVHVSTAYSNCDRQYIEEKVYPAPIDLQDLLQQCWDCPDNEIQAMTDRVLGKRPNTYIFTKAMAESVLHTYGKSIPIAIVRPSGVTPALKTPYPGWVDCRSATTGLLAAAASGMLRILYADEDVVVDIIPVDLVDNIIIAVAWKTATNGIAEPVVYNAVSGTANKILLGDLFNLLIKHTLETPQDTMLWYPSVIFTKNRWLHGLGRFWLHTVPAYLHDHILAPKANIRLVRLHNSIQKVKEVLEYFGCKDFNFEYENVPRLLREMSPQDLEMFPVDITQVDWSSYTCTYARGIRKYLLGQSDENIPLAKKRLQTYYAKDRGFKLAAAFVAYYVAVTLGTSYILS